MFLIFCIGLGLGFGLGVALAHFVLSINEHIDPAQVPCGHTSWQADCPYCRTF